LKESLILCDLTWPIYQAREVDKSLRAGTLESRIVSAITGRKTDEEELLKTGERVYNLQRAILIRQGWGGRSADTLPRFLFTDPLKSTFFDPDCLATGKDGEIISRRGAVIDGASFESMKDDYYRLRGWDVSSGLQTAAKLAELDLDDVASEVSLENRGSQPGPAAD